MSTQLRNTSLSVCVDGLARSLIHPGLPQDKGSGKVISLLLILLLLLFYLFFS